MTKIDLITGILGSGKTTLLIRYAGHLISQGRRIAVLENDFGAVNADMMMLQELRHEGCTLEMVAGGGDSDCHRRRFKTQLISLGMQGFDRVIVEPSGIFDMDEFFDLLHESPLDRWFEVGSVLTVADPTAEDDLGAQMEYLFASQAACCGKLVVSKLGIPGSGTPDEAAGRVLAHLERAIAAVKCDRKFSSADVFAKDWRELDSGDFDLLMNAGYRGARYVKLFPPEAMSSTVHYYMNVNIPENEISAVLGRILDGCGKIYRIKGGLPASGGGWIRVNAAPGRIELTPAAEGQSVLIVIGEGADHAAVDAMLRAANTDPDYVSI